VAKGKGRLLEARLLIQVSELEEQIGHVFQRFVPLPAFPTASEMRARVPRADPISADLVLVAQSLFGDRPGISRWVFTRKRCERWRKDPLEVRVYEPIFYVQ
jgi:hypothetical protein